MNTDSPISAVLTRLFPRNIDNRFPGRRIALFIFWGLTALTLWRSQHHLLAPDGGAQSIVTVPLDSYPQSAADTVVGLFALWGLSQLIVGLIYLAASLRYRALIPALYLLFMLEYLARLMIGATRSIETAGTAPGALINLPFAALGALMLALSLWPPRTAT